MARTLWSVWVIALAPVIPQQAHAQHTPPDKCAFEGRARSAVTQLPVGQVSIHLLPRGGSIGYAALSKADGSFHSEGILPGDYRVDAQRAGYSPPSLETGPSARANSSVRFAAGQTVTATLWFTPFGAISGKVIGPDDEPLSGAHITLIERKWRRGNRIFTAVQDGVSDDTGTFRLDSVPAGRYWIYAARPQNNAPLGGSIVDAPGAPEQRIAARYYPDAAQLDAASPIDIHPGEELTNINFKLSLAPVFHITGTYSGDESAGIGLKTSHGDQMLDWTVEHATLGKGNHQFEFAGIVPGSYSLYASAFSHRDLLSSAPIPVTVNSQDVRGVTAPDVRLFELKGRVSVEGDSTPDEIPIRISCDGDKADYYSTAIRSTNPEPDGSFIIHYLTPDRYTITISNFENDGKSGYYLKSLRANGVDITGRPIDLTAGPAESVELILSPDGGAIQGNVIPPEGSADAEEVTVIALREQAAPIVLYLDPGGHFQATDLAPGTYRLFAVPGYNPDLWMNSDFQRQIAGRGVPVEVAEKSTATVSIPTLRAAEIRQIEERVE